LGRFIINTGATNVAVTHKFAIRSQIPLNEHHVITVNTANGPIRVYQSYADTVELRGLKASRVFVTIQPPQVPDFGPGIDGLLGLSYLGHFEFRLAEGVLTLALPEIRK